ncbi:MAG: NAD(P)H-dependent oxidoreductase [Actinomycetota bacterium]
MKLVAINGGESASSKTRKLITPVIDSNGGTIIDLCDLSADGLLGRTDDAAVADAVARAASADVLIVATPVYRATYTGAIKAFFDRFQPGALKGTAVVLVATAIVKEHYLSLDTGGRALVASLEGWTVPTVVYATNDDFIDGEPSRAILATLGRALDEANTITGGSTDAISADMRSL